MWICIILLFSAKSVLRAWNESACIIKIVKNTNTPRFLFMLLVGEEKPFLPCQLAFFHDAVCVERKEPKTSLSRGRKRRRLFGFIIGTICCWMNVGLLMNGAERSRKPPAANFFIKAANFSHFVIKLLAEAKQEAKALRRRRHVMKRLIVKTIQIFITQLNSHCRLTVIRSCV